MRQSFFFFFLTSAGVRQLGASQEAQVAGSRPHSLGVTEAQLGAEVVGVQRLLPVHGVIAGGVVRAAHPYLDTQDDKHGAFKDDPETWKQSVTSLNASLPPPSGSHPGAPLSPCWQ